MNAALLLVLIYLALSHMPPGQAITLSPVEVLPKEDCAPTDSAFHNYCTCTRAQGLDCGADIEVEFTCSHLPEFYEEGARNTKVHCL